MKAALLGLLCAIALPAAAERRVAVLIGSNEGSVELRPLRFAEEDAAKLGAVLTELGGVKAEDLLLLKGPSLTAVHAAFDEARRRLVEARGEPTTLIVFFSGHSDGLALELGAERLTFSELKRFMEDTGASVRLAIVDSCRSGALLGAKGGTPGQAFELHLAAAPDAQSGGDRSTGTVLLTSSAADEQALESKEIGGSFFTHHFVSGLRGAADVAGNGRVTLTEAYRYAYARTVRTTAETISGPQHPAFDYRLSGQGDLVLTEQTPRSAVLVLPAEVERALAIDERRDQVVAEGGSAARLALAPGDYAIRAWRGGAPGETRVRLVAGGELRLDPRTLVAVTAPLLARKGHDAVALPPANALTFDPVFLAVQTLSLHYQRALGPGWAATLKARAGLLPESSPILKLLGGGPGTSVLGGAVGVSWFPGGEALRGFFLGPGLDAFRIARGGAPAGVLVPSLELGHAFLWPSGFDLTLAFGAQYGLVFAGRLADGDGQLGFFPRLALRAGYAW